MPAVVTALLTRTADPQRGIKWDPDPTSYLPLVTTARHHGSRVVILHDEPLTHSTPAETVLVGDAGGNVYERKWRHALAWLAGCDDDEAFVTDGTDVTMLRSPWGRLEPGTIYLGSEAGTLANRWMLRHHPHPEIQSLLRSNPRGTLYNCGLVGGKRADVLAFVETVVATYDRLHETGDPGLDMGVVNLVAHTLWPRQIVTGAGVHTTFKAYADNGRAWFAHK